MQSDWDAIVIGSGIGGLTAAGLLAAVGGKKVLVLEKHSEPGGLTHVFRDLTLPTPESGLSSRASLFCLRVPVEQ